MNAQLSVVMNLNVACEASTFDVVAMALKKFMVELGGQTPLITLDDNGYSVSCDPTADREVLTASGSCSFCTLTTANRSRGFDVRKFAFAV